MLFLATEAWFCSLLWYYDTKTKYKNNRIIQSDKENKATGQSLLLKKCNFLPSTLKEKEDFCK